MLNFVENLLTMRSDYDPDSSLVLIESLSFSNKFSTKFSIVSNKLKSKGRCVYYSDRQKKLAII
jgi:hypothetical protein